MDIEQEIQDKGLVAPRVTPARIEAVIVTEHYFTAAQGVVGAYVDAEQKEGRYDSSAAQVDQMKTSLNLLTFCVLVLENGFTVTGESACASPENFDAEIGRKIARNNAVEKIWALEGYVLKNKLSGL